MNTEVKKIKESIELDASFLGNYKEKDEVKKNLCFMLNTNMSFFHQKGENITVNDYAEKVIQNIYLILHAFASVNIYPDGFFKIMKKRKEILLKNKENDAIVQPLSEFYYEMRNEFSRLKSMNENKISGDISDIYNQIVDYHKKNNLEVGNPGIINKQYYLDDKSFESSFATEKFLLADFIDEEVECLINLLFNYMSFLVEVGINPKERLDEIIEENIKKRQK